MGEPVDDDAGVRDPVASCSSLPSSSSLSPTCSAGLSTTAQAQLPPASVLSRRRCGGSGRRRAPRLREACENASRDLVAWTRRGGAPRALLVASVGSVALVALTGLLIVVFLVVAATTNAIMFSVVVSMAAAGGFLAVLLAFLAAAYIGALSVAVFVISATTIATVIAITIVTGWAALFWVVWFAARKCLCLLTTKPSAVTRNSVI